MLGAIVGDIAGSVYERNNIKTKDFPLFRSGCCFTDDSVMTVATADALMNGGSRDDFIDAYKKWGRLYPNAGYGGRFMAWLASDSREPYGSFGNGSAMRVSPCGWLLGGMTGDAWAAVTRCAEVTHNHPEGIKGAQATAAAICIARRCREAQPGDKDAAARNAKMKSEIRTAIEAGYGYDLSRTLDAIRPGYRFNVSCQESVPQAVIAFLESTDFEDAIRNAVSIGGDSDTLAAITGSIAEAAYGIPQQIEEKALTYLDEPLLAVYSRWKKYLTEL